MGRFEIKFEVLFAVLVICLMQTVAYAAKQDSKTLFLTAGQDPKISFGLELRVEAAQENNTKIPVHIICNGPAQTPALAVDGSVLGAGSTLLNTTSSATKKCHSYTVQLLPAQLEPGSVDANGRPTIAVGIETLTIDPHDPRIGKPAIFIFNPVHGNWTKTKAYKPSSPDPQRTYTTLTKKTQQIITGVISTPEAAGIDVSSHTRDSLSKMPTSTNPSDGVLAFKEVEPDAMGTAQISMPLLLRQARGPGPSFSITNLPSGGAGVLGRGWDLQVSKITVRGPSPIYHEQFETEDYQIDGQDLIALDANGKEIPPLYKGGPILPRIKSSRSFRLRDGSSGLVVRRYGDTPSDYYWETWNPHTRVTRLYGAKLDSTPQPDTPHNRENIRREENGVLVGFLKFSFQAASRKVDGAWAITQEYDNQFARSGASYHYEASNCVGDWVQECTHALRLKQITYNDAFGRDLSETAQVGRTFVDFAWEERSQKVRYNSDGRLGFLRAQQFWLTEINVHYKTSSDNKWLAGLNPYPVNGPGEGTVLYSRHTFQLSNGQDECLNFDKVLQSVTIEANSGYNPLFATDDPSELEKQVFEFEYDGQRSCRKQSYEWRKTELTSPGSLNKKPDSGIGFPERLLDGLGFKILTSGSVLGESNSEETGGSLYVGVGPAGRTDQKSITGGLKAGYTFSKKRDGSTLVDVTGDGIDDIVYRTGGGLEYCAAQRRKDNLETTFSEGTCGRKIIGLHDIGVASSSITSVGAEVHFGFGFAGTGYNASNNESYVYFTQRDNDGLIDAVVYGKVLYNQGEVCTQNGCSVTFTPNSSLTPPLPSLTAAQTSAKQKRKPPGFTETIRRMGLKLSGISRRLKNLDYSQTTITWVAPVDGKVVLGGEFELTGQVEVIGQEMPLAFGLRGFEARNATLAKFEQYYNDCSFWPKQPRCETSPPSPLPLHFIPVPKAYIELAVSRAKIDLNRDEEVYHEVFRCTLLELDRTQNFALERLLENATCVGADNQAKTYSIQTNDVFYLTYSVHPDFTGSLKPNAQISYVEVTNDGSWGFRPENNHVKLDELIRCQWQDHESQSEQDAARSCLLESQSRFTANLSSGLLASNQNRIAVVPQAQKSQELDFQSRNIVGKFSIPTALTKDYQVYFDVHGRPGFEDVTDLTKLQLLFRQDISEQCRLSTQDRCLIEIEPVCVVGAQDQCRLFMADDAPRFLVATTIRIEHKSAPLHVTNLNSRLSNVRWHVPPHVLTHVKEETEAKDDDFVREGARIESNTSKIVAIYLPVQMGDEDTEYTRVENGKFLAPNPSLNEGSPETIDIEFSKILRDEQANVGIARLRQVLRLCGFAHEILGFLDARYSEDVIPYAPNYIDYWKKRFKEQNGDCASAKLFLTKELSYTQDHIPEFDLRDRLRLPERMRNLELEDQMSSAETLLERVLNNLELSDDLLTDHPKLTRRGYRLPVKANPLDCKHLIKPELQIERPITGPDTKCDYRFLANFAMQDIAKMLYQNPYKTDGKYRELKTKEVKTYKDFFEKYFTQRDPRAAFEIELIATVNGNPIRFSELTGAKASSERGKVPTDVELQNTCIGKYGAHDMVGNPHHFYPDKDGDIFQRIVTNRRSGRAVAFSDDIMHTEVDAINYSLGKYNSAAEMEAKQDCDGLEGFKGPNAKFEGPPSEVIKFEILENNRFIGRNRVFEFEAKPLDVIEFHMRLLPVEQKIQSKTGSTEFEIIGNFTALEIGPNSPVPVGAAEDKVLIPRSPAQLVPPNRHKTRCNSAAASPKLDHRQATCTPWTRIGWTEIFLGARYRTYSDLHRALNDKTYSLKRRREILRLHPEVKIDSNRFRLEWEKEKQLPLASAQFNKVNRAAVKLANSAAKAIAKQRDVLREAKRQDSEQAKELSAEEKENQEAARQKRIDEETVVLSQQIAASNVLKLISFAQERTPNTMQVGGHWSFFARKSKEDGQLIQLPGYDTLRYGNEQTGTGPPMPHNRFEQADDACVTRGSPDDRPYNPDFAGCNSNLGADGQDTLSFKNIKLLPLEHRFVGPHHVSGNSADFATEIGETDICASPFPKSHASCWKGQDDTVFLHRSIDSSNINLDGENDQTIHGVRSVSAMIGLEQPLIERFLFEFDAYQRIACNKPTQLIEDECLVLSNSPPLSDVDKVAQFREVGALGSEVSPPAALDGSAIVAPQVLDAISRKLPKFPNRPNPPSTKNVLEVFAPIQRSDTQAVSTNSAISFGTLSFNTSFVFNDNLTRTLYLDVNGDGFPETIQNGSAKLTSPVGLSREDWWRYFKAPSDPGNLGVASGANGYRQSSKSESVGAGFGLTPSSFAKINLKTMDAVVSPSFDLSFEKGFQTQFSDFRDFNGDGILDAISGGQITGDRVLAANLNLGNKIRTATREVLNVSNAALTGHLINNHYNTTNSTGFGVRLGFDIDTGSIVGGMGLGNRIHSSEGVLMDFTGDGRVDIVVPATKDGKNFIAVYPNLGNGFHQARLHEIPDWKGSESSVSETTLVDAGTAFTFGFNVLFVKIVFNPAIKHARNQTRELVHLRDMNGDGFPDIVTVSGLFDGASAGGIPTLNPKTDVKTNVFYNPTPKYHLLSKIKNPSRSVYEFDYSILGNSGPELGRPVWAMTKVAEFDGFDADKQNPKLYSDGHDTRLKTFVFENGYHNRAENTFYGFADATRTVFGCNGTSYQINGECADLTSVGLDGEAHNASSGFTLLQHSKRRFHNLDYLTKGRLHAEVVTGPQSLIAEAETDGTKLKIQSAPDLERVSVARLAYSIDDLQAISKPQSAGCAAIPATRTAISWSHGSYIAGRSRFPDRWRKINPNRSDSGQLFGSGSICGTDANSCSTVLTENLCSAGFYQEQTQFWAQQSGSVRERFSDLHIYAPGIPIKREEKIGQVAELTGNAVYSASGADHNQWGNSVRSYSFGEFTTDANPQPLPRSSINSTTQYSDREPLSVDVQPTVSDPDAVKDRAYPVAGLANELQVFEGAWPEVRGPPIRVRQAIFSLDKRTNLSDVCHYPGGTNFSYQPDDKNEPGTGICAQYDSGLKLALSDGLTSIQDALRKTYDSVDGLPPGDKDFTAIIHTRFANYDDYGNLTQTISPFNKDREWIERRFDYARNPFLNSASHVELQRCVHDRRGVGTDSPDVSRDSVQDCRLGIATELTADPRKSVTHTLFRSIDPHHGKISQTRDPNGNTLLMDYDAWGRFRMLARDWGTPPRHNQTYKDDIKKAVDKGLNSDETYDHWRVLTLANYGWVGAERSYLSSHIRHFASSTAYAGVSGRFDTTRHASNFADGVGKPIQSIVEAEVCAAVSTDLLASKNYSPTDDLHGRCQSIASGRVSPATARDALGRELASFEGYKTDEAQSSNAPMFKELVAPTAPVYPLTTTTLDSGGRMLEGRSRIAEAPHVPVPDAVVGTAQSAYRVVERKNLDENVAVNRFEAIAMSPRCAVRATRSDARGLITSVVENQSVLFRQTGDGVPAITGATDGIYERNYSDTLGYCKPISKIVENWPANADGAQAAEVTYQYDALLQIRKVDHPLSGLDRASITADYDLLGRLTEMRDPDSGCSNYVFDGMHNLTAETRYALEANPDRACGEVSKVASSKLYEYAADRLKQMAYSSLQEQGGDEDKRDTVDFFYDRYPHVALDGELLEAPKLVPNDLANRRFVNVTGKICENCIGQTTVVTDRTGARSFSFNELSQPKKETRSIVGDLTNVVPSEGESEAFVPEAAFYELENSYSAFGDLTLQEFNESVPSNPSPECVGLSGGGAQNCIARFTLGTRYAPDGSVATLLFNGQPLTSSAKDAINRPAVRWTHDGTTSGYFYDPFDLRMNQMATITAGLAGDANVPVQINGYQYDGGGNVLGYRNQAELKENYRSLFNFTYDGANRLTGFTGKAGKVFKQGDPRQTLKARGCYSYDLGHRFTTRDLLIAANPFDTVSRQCGQDFVTGGGALFGRKWLYEYNNTPMAARPVHAPKTISFAVKGMGIRDTKFAYDDLGRMKKASSGVKIGTPGVLSNRSMIWDAEGRLKRVRGGTDNYWKHNADLLREKYVYDFGGNRTLKVHRPLMKENGEEKAKEHTTIYQTPFYARSATSRGSVQLAHGSFPVATLVPPMNENAEPIVTYLHSDLAVGSASASVMATGDVSDAEATVISRREYSPYGHMLTTRKLAQPDGSATSPLSVFHGKELDRVTSFSSFGARSYSRDIGTWLSPDPMQHAYLFGGPNGGVLSPINISSFAFANQRPSVISDPSGQCGVGERIDGCQVISKTAPKQKDGNFVNPSNPVSINARAIFGVFASNKKMQSDFTAVDLADLGGSIQAYASSTDSSLRAAIIASATSGKEVPVHITGLRAAKSVGRSKSSFFQQGGIGRFSVELRGSVTADSSGKWKLNAAVLGEPDLQDYPYDPSRSDIGTLGTEIFGRAQKKFGGKDYLIEFLGKQNIDVRGDLNLCIGVPKDGNKILP